jgi:hypothetical protein
VGDLTYYLVYWALGIVLAILLRNSQSLSEGEHPGRAWIRHAVVIFMWPAVLCGLAYVAISKLRGGL